VKNTL